MERIVEKSLETSQECNSSDEFDETVSNDDFQTDFLPDIVTRFENFAERNDQQIDNYCFEFFENCPKPNPIQIQPVKAESSNKNLIRESIGRLRDIRDEFVTKRSEIENEREIYEYDEIVNLIDTVIENKNSYLCNSSYTNNSPLVPLLNKRIFNISKLFMEFSHCELELLIVKLVEKVINLRDSTHRLKDQVSEMEIEKEAFNWKLQVLNHALFQAQISKNSTHNNAYNATTTTTTTRTAAAAETAAAASHDEHRLMPSQLFAAVCNSSSSNIATTTNRNENCNLLIQQQQQTVRHLATTTSLNSSRSSGHRPKTKTKVTIAKNKLVIHQNP